MNIKYLKQKELPTFPKEWEGKELVDDMLLTARSYILKSENILEVTAFDSSQKIKWQIFIHRASNSYRCRTFEPEEVWGTRYSSLLKDGYYYYGKEWYSISKTTEEKIRKYLKEKSIYSSNCPATNDIVHFINHANLEKRIKQNRKKEVLLEKVERECPELPNDIETWVQNSCIPESKYIFFGPKSKNERKGWCTSCQQEVLVYNETVHNEIGYCPNCGWEVIYKSEGMGRKSLQDVGSFYIYQQGKTNTELYIRWFEVIRNYSGNIRNVNTQYLECGRMYLNTEDNTAVMYRQNWQEDYYEKDGFYYENGFYETECIYEPPFKHTKADNRCRAYNEKEALQGTKFERNKVEEFCKKVKRIQLYEYLYYRTKYPCIDYLVSLGFTNLVRERIYWGQERNAINWKGETIEKFFKMSKKEMMHLRDINPHHSTIKHIRYCKNNNIKLKEEIWEWVVKEEIKLEEIEPLFEYFSYERIKNYVEKVKRKESLFGAKTILRDWNDYIKSLKTANRTLTDEFLRPKDLYEAKGILAEQIKIEANKETDKKIKQLAKKYNAKYSYENDKYLVKAVGNIAQLSNEGKKLRHCVGDYVNQVSSGNTIILFIREKAAPKVPFYTLEIKPKKKNINVIQCRGYKNKSTTPEVDEFLEEWKKQVEKSTKNADNNKHKIAG